MRAFHRARPRHLFPLALVALGLALRGALAPASAQDASPAAPAAPAASTAPAAPEWRWDDSVSVEQIAKLTPLRNRYLEQLRALGPTAEERLAAIRVPKEEEDQLRARIEELQYQRRPGSAYAVRKVRTDQVLSDFGLTAMPFLIEAIRGGGYWSARESVDAIARLCNGPQFEDARWLAFQLQAPDAIIAMYGQGPETELVGLNLDLNDALEAIIGHELEDVAPSERTNVRIARDDALRAQQAWSAEWTAASRRWHDEETEKDRLRAQLREKLALVRAGKVPPEENR
jgi:hypothetical protein